MAVACAPLIFAVLADAASLPSWARAAVERAPASVEADRRSPATVLLDEVEIKFHEKRDAEVVLRRVLRVDHRDGRSHARVATWVDDDREVTSARAWHLPRAGRETARDESDAREVGGSDAGQVYDEARTWSISFRDVDIGSIVAYQITLRAGGLPVHTQRHSLPLECRIEEARLRVEAPAGWTVRLGAQHLGELASAEPGASLECAVGPLPAVPRQDSAGARATRIREWFVCAYPDDDSQSWSAVARWAMNLYADAATADEVVRQRCEQLTGHGDEASDLMEIARFVQHDIRYLSIALGDAGWVPEKAPRSLDNRFADCKNKTVLLQSLLSVHGVSSVPVLVHTERDPYVDVPSAFQFNHMILAIPADSVPDRFGAGSAVVNGWLLFDPTNTRARFGDLPDYLGDTYVLPLLPEGELLRTPPADMRSRLRSIAESIRLEATGAFRGRIHIRDHGTAAGLTRAIHRELGTDGVKAALESQLQHGVRIMSVSVDDGNADVADGGTFDVRIDVSGRFVRMEDDDILVSPSLTRLPRVAAPRDDPRADAFGFGRPRALTVRSRWQLSEALTAVPATVADSVGVAGTKLSFRFHSEGSALEADWKYTNTGQEIPAEDIDTMREFALRLSSVEDILLVAERAP